MSVNTAKAGDFALQLLSNPDWPAGSLGPVNVTLADQYGFELDVSMVIDRFGGTGSSAFPNESTLFSNSQSIGITWDATLAGSSIGGSTNTATMSIFSGGTPFAVDSLSFVVADIDAVDNNTSTDRCDFVTLLGDAGDPVITPFLPISPDTTFIIGPGPGAGNTGPLAANQVQCRYEFGPAQAPAFAGEDFGSVIATWPAGTSVATVVYDESIQNVQGSTAFDAANRGIGIWQATAIVVNTSISLTKTADTTLFSDGDTITYTYEVTNTGRLPIASSQDIVINDDVIGQFTCPPISTPVQPGGTFVCTATYVATAADVTAGEITNNAVAGVGSIGQDFATRLQSNTGTVTVPALIASINLTKNVNIPVTSSPVTLEYIIEVENNGTIDLTSPSLADQIVQDRTALSLTTGPTFIASSDTDGDGVLDIGETWQYLASYDVTAANISDGADIVNTAIFTTAETGAVTADATTITGSGEELTLSKNATPSLITTAGEVVTYTITLTNSGTRRAITGIVVSDPLVSNLSCTPGTGNTPVDLNPGDTAVCTGTYVVTQADIDNRGGGDNDLDNTASVSGDFAGPLPPFTQSVSFALPIDVNPSLLVTKVADQTTNVPAGVTVTYTYVVRNNGNQTLTNVSLADAHNGSGPPPVPANETLTADNGTLADSSDTATDGIWDTLAPGDEVTFTASYVVTQNDVDTLQ